MFPQAVIHLVSKTPDVEKPLLSKFKTLVNTAGFTRSGPKTARSSVDDPFLLVLLADQELAHGRDEQARYLIEAAYESFDQDASSRLFKLHFAS